MSKTVRSGATWLFGALCVAACATSDGSGGTPTEGADAPTSRASDGATSGSDISQTGTTDGADPLSAEGADATTGGPSGCEANIPPAPTGPVAPPPVTDENAPTGSVAGRLVRPGGQPIEGLRMLVCTAAICYWDDTDSDGRFLVTALTLEPLKMQTGDPNGAHLDLVFYHSLETTEISELPGHVTVPLREGEAVPWSDEGGTVTLADGQLVLDAAAGALTYPFGTLQEAVRAMRIEGTDLPPYDWAPWEGREEETFAFVVNPVGIEAEPSVTVRVHGVSDAPCSVYRIWSVTSKSGGLTYAGTATVVDTDDGLALVSDPDATIEGLTTLIFTPLEN